MPVYEITSPDGRTFEINAPDGATQEQALSYAQQHLASSAGKPKADGPGMLKSIGVGLGAGFGSSVLEGQKLLGRGLRGVGLDQAGNWLINDAQTGQDRLSGQLKPYADENPFSAKAGRIGGEIAASFAPMGAVSKAMPAYNAVGKIGKIGIGAAQGAAGSTLTPTTQTQSDGDYWTEKAKQAAMGAGIGGALSAAAPVWKNIAGVVQPVLRPDKYVGRGIVGLLSKQDAAKAADRIRSLQEIVPGSKPTTAQVAGLPALVQTEKAASNLPPFKTAITERQVSNNAARWGELEKVAGTELDLKNAVAARDVAVSMPYTAARQQSHMVDQPLSALLDTPFMKSAIKDAEKLAANNQSGPIMQTQTMRQPGVGAPITQTTMTGDGAHYIKLALDDMLDQQARMGVTGAENRALRNVRSSFMSWLESKSPEYAQGRQTFASMSPNIEGMTAAQAIRERLSDAGRGLAADGALPMMTAPGYSTALRLAKNGLEFGMEPGQEVALGAIAKDLQRSTVSNSIRSGSGSDTAYNLAADSWLAKQLFGGGFQGATPIGRGIGGAISALLATPLGPWTSGLAGGVAMTGANKIGQAVGGRLQNSLTDLLMNPEAMLPYLERRAAGGYGPEVGIPGLPDGPLAQLLIDSARKSTAPGLMGIFMGNQ